MLTEHVAALQGGRLRFAESGEPVSWEPAPMVLPVSEKLRAMVTGSSAAGRSEERHLPRDPRYAEPPWS